MPNFSFFCKYTFMVTQFTLFRNYRLQDLNAEKWWGMFVSLNLSNTKYIYTSRTNNFKRDISCVTWKASTVSTAPVIQASNERHHWDNEWWVGTDVRKKCHDQRKFYFIKIILGGIKLRERGNQAMSPPVPFQ